MALVSGAQADSGASHHGAAGVLRGALRTLHPWHDERHGPLPPTLVALTLLTGVVDAASYLRLGHVFVANMTGNVAFLGFALAGAGGLAVSSSLTAIGAFLLGAVLGGRIVVRARQHRGRMLRSAAVVQAGLIAVALAIALGADHPSRGVARYAVLVALALAMGVQNATAQRLAVPELTTTVLTRTLTSLAARSRAGGGRGANTGRRLMAILAMLVGALAGGLLALHVSVASAIAVALAIASLVAIAMNRTVGSHAPWTRS